MQQPMGHENEKRKLCGEPSDHNEPETTGAIGFAGRPFVLRDQAARSVLRRIARNRLRGSIGKLAEIFGPLFDEKQGDDSREYGAGRDNFPTEAPIAAVQPQKFIDLTSHEETANAGTAEDQADRAAAVSFEPSRGGRAAGHDV